MNDMSTAPSMNETGEAAFGLQELFYSRTDKRGIIRAGNAVFQRVSGFDWDMLLGAPHRVVRHPDTPKAVFRVLWQTIQKGEPAVAYVKNRSASGRYYWVLATVLPLHDGYLSIHIKPTSAFFQTVRTAYADLVAEERAEGLAAEISAGRLAERLSDLGFASHESFMTHALLQETAARDRNLRPATAAIFAEIDRVRAGLAALSSDQDALVRDFERLRDLPTNMRIIASRLEPSGGPVSAISENYKVTSTELFGTIRAFAAGETSLLVQMLAAFDRAILQLLAARLQAEALQHCEIPEVAAAPIDPVAERRCLVEVSRNCDARASAELNRAEQSTCSLRSECSDIRRAMLGLDSIRVMGRVESGRLGPDGAHLAATIDQLDLRHSAIIARLEQIMELSAAIDSGIRRIRVLHDPATRRALPVPG